MPKTTEKKNNEKIKSCSPGTPPVSPKRDVKIIPEPG
jgi:hypothetical protein